MSLGFRALPGSKETETTRTESKLLRWVKLCPVKIQMLEPQPPKGMVFGEGAFQREWGVDKVMKMGLSWWDQWLIRRDTRELAFFFSLPCEDAARQLSTWTHTDLRVPASTTGRSKFVGKATHGSLCTLK